MITASASEHVTPSRHRIRPFRLELPATVAEAAGLLSEHGDAAVAMAGGVDVVNRLKAGGRVERLVDLQGISDLRGISVDRGVLRVGALVTHREFERDHRVEEVADGLGAIWALLGNVRIRIVGTVVGNVLARAAQYDAPPVLLALDARAVLSDGTQEDVAQLLEGEIDARRLITAMELPMRGGQVVAYNRDLKPAVTVAVAVHRTDGALVGKLAVGCALPIAAAAHLDLGGATDAAGIAEVADEAARAAVAALPPFRSDHHASADYRRHVAAVLAARELRRIGERITADT